MSYVLSEAAEADLRGVIRYTRNMWGEQQARLYAEKLKNGIIRMSQGKGAFREMDDIYPSLRMARIEHHYAFCLLRQNSPVLVVAILHERMDLLSRLADRLKTSAGT